MAAVTTLSKGEFAARMGVTPGRVSQWIKEGKIPPEAMEGAGHRARIHADIAARCITERTDPGQRLGNGLGTAIRAETFAAPALPLDPLTPRPMTVAEQIAAEQLQRLQRQNRQGEEDERARLGLYTLTADMRRAMGRLALDLMSAIEGGLPEMSRDLAAKFGLPQRDILHELQASFRAVRARAAANQAEIAANLPERVTDPQDEAAAAETVED